MSVRLAIIAAAVLLFVPSAHAIPPLPSVPFRTVAHDDGAASAIGERKSLTVRSERRWRRLWSRLTNGELPAPQVPEIDFRRHMLIVVTQGRRPSGGHTIDVERILRTGNGWRVEVLEIEPGAGCVTAGVITAPYHVVRVKRSRARIRFERERTEADCR